MGEIEKSPLRIISYFGGSNNIFVDCISKYSMLYKTFRMGILSENIKIILSILGKDGKL